MDKNQAISWQEQQLQRVARDGRTYAERACGDQFLLVCCEGRYYFVYDGMLCDDECVEEVYRLNIFGKLVKKNCYTL